MSMDRQRDCYLFLIEVLWQSLMQSPWASWLRGWDW
jgi:hypothetical protein